MKTENSGNHRKLNDVILIVKELMFSKVSPNSGARYNYIFCSQLQIEYDPSDAKIF